MTMDGVVGGIEPQIRYSFSGVTGGLESIKCFFEKAIALVSSV